MRRTSFVRIHPFLDPFRSHLFTKNGFPRLSVSTRTSKTCLNSVQLGASSGSDESLTNVLKLRSTGIYEPAELRRFNMENGRSHLYAQCKFVSERLCKRTLHKNLVARKPLSGPHVYDIMEFHKEIHTIPYIMSAPFFLAPIMALLKSSFVLKASTAVYTFIKTSFVAKAFASVVAYLKSGAAFKIIGLISRGMLSLVTPLRVLSKRIMHLWHGEEHMNTMKASQKAAGETGRRRHFTRTTKFLIWTPVILLIVGLLASIEHTPIWGRWRLIMMSAEEETIFVEEFLRPGTNHDDTSKRDWVAILRAASGEENDPPGTISGRPVLDPATDWRAQWVKDVLTKLENGLHHLNLNSNDSEQIFEIMGSARNVGKGQITNEDVSYLLVPPVDYSLEVRPAALKHKKHSGDYRIRDTPIIRYGCLVLDSPECNAFSIGFGPATCSGANSFEEAPGVIVVYTGLLEEIFRGRISEKTSLDREIEPKRDSTTNALFGIFRQASVSSGRTIPGLMISKEKSDQLACTLAHELAHILLSHSLESHPSNDFYEFAWTLITDVVRITLYPVTMYLGPLFNDWLGQLIRNNSALGLKVSSSCASRMAEIEADLLGLRILLGAGIDPRIALDDWAPGGLFDRAEMREKETAALDGENDDENSLDAEGWLNRNGFTRSHPFNSDRHKRILEELEAWEKMGKDIVLGRKPEDDQTMTTPASN